MNFKVFGGAGFIGNHLVKNLLSEGHKVTVFDVKKPMILGANVYRPDGGEASWFNPVGFIGGDVSDYRSVYYAIDRGDRVINLSAISQFDACENEPARAVSINVSGALNIAQACIENKASHYTFVSSGAVYSQFTQGIIDETGFLAPASFYGLTKKLAEEALDYYEKKFPCSILRLPHVYGPGKTWGANSMITQLLQGNRPVIYGDGLSKADFTYVEDVVQAIKLVSVRYSTGTYNVGSGGSRTVNDFFNLVKMYLDSMGVSPQYVAPRKFENKDFQMDIKKISALGYKPKYDIESGLEKTIREWQQWL